MTQRLLDESFILKLFHTSLKEYGITLTIDKLPTMHDIRNVLGISGQSNIYVEDEVRYFLPIDDEHPLYYLKIWDGYLSADYLQFAIIDGKYLCFSIPSAWYDDPRGMGD